MVDGFVVDADSCFGVVVSVGGVVFCIVCLLLISLLLILFY